MRPNMPERYLNNIGNAISVVIIRRWQIMWIDDQVDNSDKKDGEMAVQNRILPVATLFDSGMYVQAVHITGRYPSPFNRSAKNPYASMKTIRLLTKLANKFRTAKPAKAMYLRVQYPIR
jgi:hypothetical protein